MTNSQLWLSRYVRVCVLATLILLFIGGMVTSKKAGMAVPDWPLSYGSINPVGWWTIENVRLEHGHRLVASAIGLLMIGLAFWTWRVETRRWVKWLSLGALGLVIVQGVMGGLRVTEISTVLAVIHGCTAQIFLCVLVMLSVVLSPKWSSAFTEAREPIPTKVAISAAVLTVLVFLQLIVGAIMRHFNAGLAIPTFPLAFGHVIPPLASFPVAINFAHRVGAVLVTLGSLHLLSVTFLRARFERRLTVPVCALVLLVALQIALGAEIIVRARPPIQTTLHVVNGALILATSVIVCVRAAILRSPDAHGVPVTGRDGIPELEVAS